MQGPSGPGSWWRRSSGAQLSLSVLAASTASAAGILPPSNPPANITFDVAPPCSSVGDSSAACFETLLHDINAGRNSEGLPSMVLPNGYAQMSGTEQLLVLANLERGARGLAQFAGLSPTLDAVSAAAATANADPTPPVGYPFSQWGSNYADAVDPLESDFLWMYDDGVGGTNYDCQAGNFSGCWGHRTNILGPWANSGSETTAMGDAATAAGAFTEIFANKWGAPDGVTVPYSSVTYPGSVAPQVVQVSPAGATAPGTGTRSPSPAITSRPSAPVSSPRLTSVRRRRPTCTSTGTASSRPMRRPTHWEDRPTPWPSPSPHRPGRRAPWARAPMRSATAPPRRHR